MLRRQDDEKQALLQQNHALREENAWLRSQVSTLTVQFATGLEEVRNERKAVVELLRAKCAATLPDELRPLLTSHLAGDLPTRDLAKWVEMVVAECERQKREADYFRRDSGELTYESGMQRLELEQERQRYEAELESRCDEVLATAASLLRAIRGSDREEAGADSTETNEAQAAASESLGVRATGTVGKPDIDGLIHLLAEGNECRRTELLGLLGIQSAGQGTDLLHSAIRAGMVDVVEARLGAGRPANLFRLTDKGQARARALGVEPVHGLPELLKRHVSPSQVLLVLRTVDVMKVWGEYGIDLYPSNFRTPSGRLCRPDLLLFAPRAPDDVDEWIYLEVELHPQPSVNYARDQERIAKWSIFWEANHEALYVATLAQRHQEKMIEEIRQWHQATGKAVELNTVNATGIGCTDWASTTFPEK